MGLMGADLQLQSWGFCFPALRCGGRNHLAHVVLSATKVGAIWAVLAAVYLWRTQGLESVWSRPDALVFGFAVGFLLWSMEALLRRDVVIGEEGIAVRYGATPPLQFARTAVREISLERLPPDSIALEVRWLDEKRPLRVCTRADRVESALEWLSATYPVKFRENDS